MQTPALLLVNMIVFLPLVLWKIPDSIIIITILGKRLDDSVGIVAFFCCYSDENHFCKSKIRVGPYLGVLAKNKENRGTLLPYPGQRTENKKNMGNLLFRTLKVWKGKLPLFFLF